MADPQQPSSAAPPAVAELETCEECGETPCPAKASDHGLLVSQCPVCDQTVDDPRTLRCLHTVCLSCLSTLQEATGIKCPLCGFHTSCAAPHLLPRNTYAESEVRRRQGLKTCRNCGVKPASTYCVNGCRVMLCDSCDATIHSNPIFRGHERVSLSPPKTQAQLDSERAEVAAARSVGCIPVPVYCHRHGSTPLTLFSVSSRESICTACQSESHRGHTVRPIAAAAPTVLETQPAAVQALSGVSSHLAIGVRDVSACQRKVTESASTTERTINATFDRLAAQVEARRQFLLRQAAETAETKHELLSAQRGSLTTMLRSIRRSQFMCTALNKHAADFTLPELLDIAAHAEPYCKFVRDQRLDVEPCVDPDIHPDFGEPMPEGSTSPATTRREDALLSAIDGFGRIVARTVMERRFVFENVGDHNGVLYFFGTSRGIKIYKNPHLSKRVTVTASSTGYGRLENIVSDGPSDFCTHNEPFSWVAVELEASVRVDRYALYHDSYDPESHFLRNWELQGWSASAEGGQWDTLSSHHNDKALSEQTPSGSWAVDDCRAEGYRRLRLIQTGLNSHGNHYLMASGLELYGVLLG